MSSRDDFRNTISNTEYEWEVFRLMLTVTLSPTVSFQFTLLFTICKLSFLMPLVSH